MLKVFTILACMALTATSAYCAKIDSLKIELALKQDFRDSLSLKLAYLDSNITTLKKEIARLTYQGQMGVSLQMTMEGKLKDSDRISAKVVGALTKYAKVKASAYGNGFFKVHTDELGAGYLHSVYIKETEVVKAFMEDEQSKIDAAKKLEQDRLAKEAQARLLKEQEEEKRRESKRKKQQLADAKAIEEAAKKHTQEIAKTRQKAESIKDRERRNMANKYRNLLPETTINYFLNNRLAIGMPEDMVLFIAGWPSDRNVTKSGSGTREQWVYKTPKTSWEYLYFKNGILTTMQN